jgi:hypothetical protein
MHVNNLLSLEAILMKLHSIVCSPTIKENVALQMNRILEDSELLMLREKKLHNYLQLLMVCVLVHAKTYGVSILRPA